MPSRLARPGPVTLLRRLDSSSPRTGAGGCRAPTGRLVGIRGSRVALPISMKLGGVFMANLRLKGALIQRYGTQLQASRALGVSPSRLSLIVQGHYSPTSEEMESFKRVLGSKTKQVFDSPQSIHRRSICLLGPTNLSCCTRDVDRLGSRTCADGILYCLPVPPSKQLLSCRILGTRCLCAQLHLGVIPSLPISS